MHQATTHMKLAETKKGDAPHFTHTQQVIHAANWCCRLPTLPRWTSLLASTSQNQKPLAMPHNIENPSKLLRSCKRKQNCLSTPITTMYTKNTPHTTKAELRFPKSSTTTVLCMQVLTPQKQHHKGIMYAGANPHTCIILTSFLQDTSDLTQCN
jgi:hypothetical protein